MVKKFLLVDQQKWNVPLHQRGCQFHSSIATTNDDDFLPSCLKIEEENIELQ
jgi:hypothetical protein